MTLLFWMQMFNHQKNLPMEKSKICLQWKTGSALGFQGPHLYFRKV